MKRKQAKKRIWCFFNIYGDVGSGKTTVLLKVKELLEHEGFAVIPTSPSRTRNTEGSFPSEQLDAYRDCK